ncbi:MAG TPA: T9SS type A sorting domain-containing protein [Candidatus Krumholzibacteria bacterium]
MAHSSRSILFFAVTSLLCLAGLHAPRSAPSRAVAGRGDADPCGTWRALAPARTGQPVMLVTRPPVGTQQVASSHFIVHYYGDSLDTYAQSVSDAAEYTYRILVDTLSHLPPPSDGVVGGDARTDIYLRPYTVMGSAYGTTYYENPVGTPYPNSWTSWVELVDTMGTTRRLPITAHEVYHTIQIGYDRYESGSLLEMFSTWIQDRAYDASNIHYATTRLFFRQPHVGLFAQVYKNVPWAFYLTEKYGDAIIEKTLEKCGETPGANPREAFDDALQQLEGIGFLTAFIDFGTFNYFVGARDDGQHYNEGAEYYTTTREHRSRCYPEELITPTFPPAELGANYMLLDGDDHAGPLMLYFYPEYLASTMLTMTRFKGATQMRSTTYYTAFTTPIDSIPIPDWAECDSVLLVYQVDLGSNINSWGYTASHRHVAPPASDWVLVYDRDQCRVVFDGYLDEYLDRDGEDRPFAEILRKLGANVVVEDVLPADLTGCTAIFLVGGFGAGGINISDADLARLNAYMDGGGDIYVEGNRLGEYMDPLLGAGNTTQQAFWTRFSCAFTPGPPEGDLGAAWDTGGNAFLGTHQFSYDPGPPSAYVGELTPLGNSAYLVRDSGGKVRAVARRAVGGSSTRIMATMLLGGSTGVSGSTREGFLSDVLTLFDTNVAALAVSRATVTVNGRDVAIDGVLEHFDGRALSLVRDDTEGRHDIALEVASTGGEWRFSARDRLETESATYQLIDVDNNRVLWDERVSERTPEYALRLTGIYPNPARDGVRLGVDSPSDGRAEIGVYDVAGRRVASEPAMLHRGSNVLFIRSLPGVSGVYFVHIDAPAGSVRGRLLVLR